MHGGSRSRTTRTAHRPRRAMVHVAGGPEYRKFCEDIASRDYEGFALR